MSIMPPIRQRKLSAEMALLMSRVEIFKRKRQELLAEVARLDKKIAAGEMLIEDLADTSIAEQEQQMVGEPVPPLPQGGQPAIRHRARSNTNLTAVQVMRDIATRIGRESPDAFSARQVMEAFRSDDRLDERLKNVNEGYIYHVMKRLCVERLIAKVGRKYVLLEKVQGAEQDPTGMVMASKEGFKIVPMTKEERIREETRRYLSRRPNKR
jgi:hypothetical protein